MRLIHSCCMFDETDSALHCVQVDLVGVAVVNGSTPRVARQVLQGCHNHIPIPGWMQDRLIVNQQLLSLGRLLRELADHKATRAAEVSALLCIQRTCVQSCSAA